MTISETGKIVVKIVAAHDIADEDTGPGKSDVYFKLYTNEADEQKSRTVSGKNPQFGDQTFTFDVTASSTELYIQAMDSDVVHDDKIGKAKVSIPEIMKMGHVDAWFDLKGTLGIRKHGEVHLVVDYIPGNVGQGQGQGKVGQGQYAGQGQQQGTQAGGYGSQVQPGMGQKYNQGQQQAMPASGYGSQMQSGMGQKYNQGQPGMSGQGMMGSQQGKGAQGNPGYTQGQAGGHGFTGQNNNQSGGLGEGQGMAGMGGQQYEQQPQPGMGNQGVMGQPGMEHQLHHHHGQGDMYSNQNLPPQGGKMGQSADQGQFMNTQRPTY